jgi:uncharacterized membrane protein YfcA
MKKFLLLFFCFTCLTAFSQNVGIGTENPSETLDVNGRIAAKGYKNTIYSAAGIFSATLSTAGAWTDIPDMSVTFSLPDATTVISSYNFTGFNNSGSSASFFCLRILIDGVPYAVTARSISSGFVYFNSSGQATSELGAGNHTVKVQYYLSSGIPIVSTPSSFQERSVQVLVFGAI